MWGGVDLDTFTFTFTFTEPTKTTLHSSLSRLWSPRSWSCWRRVRWFQELEVSGVEEEPHGRVAFSSEGNGRQAFPDSLRQLYADVVLGDERTDEVKTSPDPVFSQLTQMVCDRSSAVLCIHDDAFLQITLPLLRVLFAHSVHKPSAELPNGGKRLPSPHTLETESKAGDEAVSVCRNSHPAQARNHSRSRQTRPRWVQSQACERSRT